MAIPIEGVRTTDRFDTFFVEEHQRLFKALYFITGNRHDAEDLMQDAFVKLWERWSEIDRIDDPTAYLFTVALNGSRMRARRASMAARREPSAQTERDGFADAEIRTDVKAMLRLLTPRQRAALLLIDLLGYPSEEAAAILHVRASTVRALATHARQVLRNAEGTFDA